jgi:hypothetical protein
MNKYVLSGTTCTWVGVDASISREKNLGDSQVFINLRLTLIFLYTEKAMKFERDVFMFSPLIIRNMIYPTLNIRGRMACD